MLISLFEVVLVFGSAFLSFDLFVVKRRASVLVDSFAEENYLKSKETDEGLLPEMYQLVQGKKIGGYISHKSLSDVPFIEVVENWLSSSGLETTMRHRLRKRVNF